MLHTFSNVSRVLSASWNIVGLPSISKRRFLMDCGVGEEAKG